MYTIYSDGKLLHSPHLLQEGCGVLSPKLTVELNKAGSLEYTMPPNHILYDSVSKLKSIITVFQNGDELFRGRILHDEKDFYKQKVTYCEGELAFLLDSVQRPYKYDGTFKGLFTKLITNHNSRVDESKRFTVGNVTIAKANTNILHENVRHSKTIDEINDVLLSNAGGYFKIRKSGETRYIDWLAESGEVSSQIIEFGVNLLDITEYITAENIFTVLIPIGASLDSEDGNQNEKLDITSVNDGKDYVENSTAINLFGRIENYVEWSEIDNASKLKTVAQEYLDKNIEMSVTLTLKAVDLHLLNVNVNAIRLGDWVPVISVPHGLNRNFQCTKITYDMTSPDQDEYTFGINFTSLTEKQVKENKVVQSTVTGVQSAISIATASANAANQAAKDVQNVITNIPVSVMPVTTVENIWNNTFNS